MTSSGSCVEREREKFLARGRGGLPAFVVVTLFLICGAVYKAYGAVSLAHEAGMDVGAMLEFLATVGNDPGGRDLVAHEAKILGRAVTAGAYVVMLVLLVLVAAGERARRASESILWRYIGELETERGRGAAHPCSDVRSESE